MRAFALALFGMAVLTASLPAQSSWETVTSKEGQFTVEMPAKPSFTRSRTRTGRGGRVKIIMTGCESGGAVYLALKVEVPTRIVRGAEDAELDSERDSMAEQWHGKVISEKKVRAEGRPGRDFTIRGKPDEGAGVLMIRVREYLVGNAIYLVAVVSPLNRELPEDSGRFLGSLAIGTTKARAAGTPEFEQVTGKELAGWGMAIDPGEDCEIRPESKSLTVKVPGTLHDLNPDSGKLNAPRIIRPVEGDFSVTVKVAGDFKPGGTSTNPKSVPYNGAGIIIWSNPDNFIRLERGVMLRKGKVGTYIAFEEREGGYRGAVHNGQFRAGDCYLRVERKGSRIFGSVSSDGNKWLRLKPIDTVWPARLRVGLTAINSSSEPFAVRFEEFSFSGKGAGNK